MFINLTKRFKVLLIVFLVFVIAGSTIWYILKPKSIADTAAPLVGNLIGHIYEYESSSPIANATLTVSNVSIFGRARMDIYTDADGQFIFNDIAESAEYSIRVTNIDNWDRNNYTNKIQTFSILGSQSTEIQFVLSNDPNAQANSSVELFQGLKIRHDDIYSGQERIQISAALSSVPNITEDKYYEIINTLSQRRFWQIANSTSKLALLNTLVTTYPELQSVIDLEQQQNWYLIPAGVPVIDPYNIPEVDIPSTITEDDSNLGAEKALAASSSAENKRIWGIFEQWENAMRQKVDRANQAAGRIKYAQTNWPTFKVVGALTDKSTGQFSNFQKCLTSTKDLYSKNFWKNNNNPDYLPYFYNIYTTKYTQNYRLANFTQAEKNEISALVYIACSAKNVIAKQAFNFDDMALFKTTVLTMMGAGVANYLRGMGIVKKAFDWGNRVGGAGRFVAGAVKGLLGIAENGGVIDYVVSGVFGKISVNVGRMFGASMAKNIPRMQKVAIEDMEQAMEKMWNSPMIKDERNKLGDSYVKDRILTWIEKVKFTNDLRGEGFLDGAVAYANVDGSTSIGDHALMDIFNQRCSGIGGSAIGRKSLSDVYIHEYLHHAASKFGTSRNWMKEARGMVYDVVDEGFIEYFTRQAMPELQRGAYQAETEVIDALVQKYAKLYGVTKDQATAVLYSHFKLQPYSEINKLFKVSGSSYYDSINTIGVLMQDNKYDQAKQFITTLQKP